MRRFAVAAASLVLSVSALAQGIITSPEQAFGFAPGTDRKLADWKELVSYFRTLGPQSDRVHYDEIGKTTEGRPFVTVTISAPENLAQLDEYKQIQAALADSRRTSEEQAKDLILFGFRPQHRAQPEVMYRFPFNALLYAASHEAALPESGKSAARIPHSKQTKGD